jgi:hypothetical protein
MVSINKDNQQAITDVSSFISRQWQEESNSYINIDFDSINKNESLLSGKHFKKPRDNY